MAQLIKLMPWLAVLALAFTAPILAFGLGAFILILSN